MVQLSASLEQTHETQLAQHYDVLGFRRIIARYNVLTMLYEIGTWGQINSGYLRRRSGRKLVENLRRRTVTLVPFHESAP